MGQSLKGKIAVITGASRGIGRAIAIRLGRDGALVAVHSGVIRAPPTERCAKSKQQEARHSPLAWN